MSTPTTTPKPDLRRCITIHQPWAFLIIRPDLTDHARQDWLTSPDRKNVENRKRRLHYTGTLWIHAGGTFDHESHRAIYDSTDSLPLRHALRLCDVGGRWHQTGGIIGKVKMTGCVQHHSSPWFSGPFAYTLEEPIAVPFERCRGFQGIWYAGDRKPALPPTSVEIGDRTYNFTANPPNEEEVKL